MNSDKTIQDSSLQQQPNNVNFDFTTPLNFQEIYSQKWSLYEEDVLPLWVADTDFTIAPAITKAIEARVAQGALGYGFVPQTLVDALNEWSQTHYGWALESDWQVWIPGVVPAINIATLAFSEPGDGVLTATPIYPPFLQVGKNTQRETQTFALAEPSEAGGLWQIDWQALEDSIQPNTRILLLSHPHNPTGRVWTEQELLKLADVAKRHELIVISDELHCDLILDGSTHQPLGKLCPELKPYLITLWAPSKTFNIAGLSSSVAVIEDEKLRTRFAQFAKALLPKINVLGIVASVAAYSEGEPWRLALIDTLKTNLELIERYVARWPNVSLSRPAATHLAWLDLRNAGLGESPQKTLVEKARVGLSDGADFAAPGFARLNFGLPTAQLEQALKRMDALLAK